METARVQCPYCFELVDMDLDPETEGSFVQDCEVCCNPWQVFVARDDDGVVQVDVQRADG